MTMPGPVRASSPLSGLRMARAFGPDVWTPVAAVAILLILAAWVALAVLPVHGISGAFGLRDFSVHWAIMSIAMMLPGLLTSLPVRDTARSAAMVTGYLVPWITVAPLAWAMGSAIPTPLLFLIAAGWQVVPWRTRALTRCPESGLRRGAWCLVACGPLMLALTAITTSAHATAPWAGVIVMGIATLAMMLERRSRTMTWELAFALLVAAAVLIGVGAVEPSHIGHHGT